MASTLSKIKEVFSNKSFRMFKVLEYGAKTANESSPFGVDSHPVNDTTAVMIKTDTISKSVILGFLQKNRKAEKGEIRFYSTDEDGNEKTFLWLRNDGTIEIAGDSDNAVKFIPLDSALQNMVGQINSQLTAIASGITSAGGAYVPTNITLDISASKVNEVKLP
jgi:hypothetical protein